MTTPDDVKEAEERLQTHRRCCTENEGAGWRQSPYYSATEDRWNCDQSEADLFILADAYLSLGERQPDRFARSPFVNVAFDTPEQLLAIPYLGNGDIVRVVTFISPVEEKGTT